jgi:small conductance mechanosensitive channel
MEANAQQIVQTVTTLVSTWGLRVVGALAILLVGRIVAGTLRRSARRGLERSQVDASLVPFLSSLVYYLALAIVLVAVLNLFGIQTASIIAILGAAGLAVGLALQGTLSNFAAGVMLLLFRPFTVGDFVEVSGIAGVVDEVGVFSTTLHTGDNVRIVVPNSKIYGDILKNYSAAETRRIDLVIGISYTDDIGRAIEVLLRTLTSDPRVLKEPEPLVAVSELADSSVNLVVRPWCTGSDYWGLRFDLTRSIKEELESAGCSIPFPQRDVHVHTNGAAAG